MRILIVSDKYESLSIRSVDDFEGGLRKRGVETEVSFFLRLRETNGLEKNKYGVFRKKNDTYIVYLLKFIFALIRHIISRRKYDVFIIDDVVSYGFVVSVASKILNKKTILTIHGLFEDEWKEREKNTIVKYYFSLITSKITLMCSDQIVINDDRMFKLLCDKGVPQIKIWKRYVCFDEHLFSRDLINSYQLRLYQEKYNLPSEYILFVGSIDVRDGILDALDIFRKINEHSSDVKCVIVGEGSLEPKLCKFIEENPNIDIRYIGKVDYRVMPYIYYNSSAVLLPNYPPQAGIGKIILEALSMECPVITTNAGIFDLIIKDNVTGFIAPVGNVDIIAEKTMYLLDNPHMRHIIGKNGRTMVIEHYSVKKYLDNWAESLRVLSN